MIDLKLLEQQLDEALSKETNESLAEWFSKIRNKNKIMNKKEFALEQIAPYYKNPEICGYENGRCLNLTSDGKMCVFGKNLLHPELSPSGFISSLLPEDDIKQLCLKPEVRGILESGEWWKLQKIHDAISANTFETFCEELLLYEISQLNLFTLEELKEKANSL